MLFSHYSLAAGNLFSSINKQIVWYFIKGALHENDRSGFLKTMTMSIRQRISPKNMNFREFQLMKTQGRRGIRVRSVTVSV